MRYEYIPQGVCSEEIIITLDGDIVREVEFIGGCEGNLKAISCLVRGRRAEEVIRLLGGLTCDDKGTSCGDQLSIAVRAALEGAISAS